MGNRANVHFVDNDIHVYLHWNGGIESVAAFLQQTANIMGNRTGDAQYFTARFIQVVGNFFGGNTSLGVSNKFYDGKSYKVKVGKTVSVAYNGKDYQELSDIVEGLKGDEYWSGHYPIIQQLNEKTPSSGDKSAYTVFIDNDGAIEAIKTECYSWDAHDLAETTLSSGDFADSAKVIAVIEGWGKAAIL